MSFTPFRRESKKSQLPVGEDHITTDSISTPPNEKLSYLKTMYPSVFETEMGRKALAERELREAQQKKDAENAKK